MSSPNLTNRQLASEFGRRKFKIGTVILNEPSEEGYQCPKGHRWGQITWSEFNKHIWCYICKLDYPSASCPVQRVCWMDGKYWQEMLDHLPFVPRTLPGIMHCPDCKPNHLATEG